MSQHFFQTMFEDHPVSVLMGWDRPLQGFFMTVQRIGGPLVEPADASGETIACVDANSDGFDDEDEDDFVYSNHSDPGLARSWGLSASLTYFTNKLEELGLVVPEAMLKGVAQDGERNVGSRYVEYEADGSIKPDA
jgi:hypothetical protein